MYTRTDYLNRNVTFIEYYGQFVTGGIRQAVLSTFGKERLEAALLKDEHLDNIPLRQWYALAIRVCNTTEICNKMKSAGDYLTLAGQVCILKEAARQIAMETKE